jgi:hypothetical protein
MRMVVSAKTEHQIVWKITKCETTQPLGIKTVTFYQNYWNDHTDYLERDKDGNIIGAWADYYKSEVTPIEPDGLLESPLSLSAVLSSATHILKSGGTYKTINISITNDTDDITNDYSDAEITWSCSINNQDWTDKVTWKSTKFNQMKVKFPADTTQLGKILKVKCNIKKDKIVINSNELLFEITE